jgi:hypothetical protein
MLGGGSRRLRFLREGGTQANGEQDKEERFSEDRK